MNNNFFYIYYTKIIDLKFIIIYNGVILMSLCMHMVYHILFRAFKVGDVIITQKYKNLYAYKIKCYFQVFILITFTKQMKMAYYNLQNLNDGN